MKSHHLLTPFLKTIDRIIFGIEEERDEKEKEKKPGFMLQNNEEEESDVQRSSN